MTLSCLLTYFGCIILQAIVNIFVYVPAILVALYLYERFIKNNDEVILLAHIRKLQFV